MAAQFPGGNNGGGGRLENLIGMTPAEAAAMASWAARYVAAAKESIEVAMREQQFLAPPPPPPTVAMRVQRFPAPPPPPLTAAMRVQQFRPPPPPPLTAAMGGWTSNLGPCGMNTSGAATHRAQTGEHKKCELCNVLCTSPVMVAEHENGQRHQKKVKMLQKNIDSDHPRTITVTMEQPAEVTTKKKQKSKKKKGEKRAIKAESDGGDQKEASKKQKAKENTTEMPFKCFMCDIKCIDKMAFDRHLCGKKHVSKVRSHWAKERPFRGLQGVYPQQSAGTSASTSVNW